MVLLISPCGPKVDLDGIVDIAFGSSRTDGRKLPLSYYRLRL